MVSYTYNAWGEIISTTGTLASTIGAINKLRYRSYYYDTETGFYYLQSRYYDPIVKRFISPDSTDYLTANGDFDGYNLYAYCVNNPVVYIDYQGFLPSVTYIKKNNSISLELKVPWRDIGIYFSSRSYVSAVIGIIACFIPEPTISKAIGVASGIDSIASSIISSVISTKKQGQSIRVGFSFNYKTVVNRKYKYIVKTKWIKIGYWHEWKSVNISNIKWWVKL